MKSTGNRKGRPAQTVMRALSLLEAVASGVHDLDGLSKATGLSQSTAYRLLNTLVHANYLRYESRQGYAMGPKLIELGFKAHSQLRLPAIAKPHLQWLSSVSQETVHLGILEGQDVVYIDKVEGKRNLQMASYIGGRQPARCTGLGKALISAQPPVQWRQFATAFIKRTANTITDPERFLEEIAQSAARGYALDMEENEQGIRCVAAPVYDVTGACVAAISVTSASIFMDEERIQALIPLVKTAAHRISQELGWSGEDKQTGDNHE